MRKLIILSVGLLFLLNLGASGQTPPKEQNQYQQSLDLVNAGKTEAALDKLNEIIVKSPRHFEAIYLRAYVHLQQKNPQGALKDYNTYLKANPDHIGALTNRALVYMELEQYESALKDLNKRIQLEGSNWMAYFDRAYCHALSGDYSTAITDFTKAIELNPKASEAYANRGFSKINMLTLDGLIKPDQSQMQDACMDLEIAFDLGDTTVVKMREKYCN